ncbi:MAG: hypothetical protein ABI605_01175 [Rhizobacter sp.]
MSIFSRRSLTVASMSAAALLLGGCATTEQTRADAHKLLQESTQAMSGPQALVTRYTTSLEQFGRMLEVYRANDKSPVYVQSRSIGDATGLSHPLAGAELPADITEMVRSAVNRIGDHIVYVPFQPDYVAGHVQQGARIQMTLPHVLITGAITEFDRALAASGRGVDLGLLFGKGKGETDASLSHTAASTISRLSLDFNLMDFGSQTLIPRMQATNSMRLLNDSTEGALDFAIYGNGFGLTSSTRYLQGRHNAIRLLVDMSMVQLLGRYLNVPYWRCLPDGAPDAVVLQRIAKRYAANDPAKRVRWMQETLRDYGFALEVNGRMDERTGAALDSVIALLKLPKPKDPKDRLDPEVFTRVYINVPLDTARRTAGL